MVLINSLVHLFNKSLFEDIATKEFKLVKITPIFKKKDIQVINN